MRNRIEYLCLLISLLGSKGTINSYLLCFHIPNVLYGLLWPKLTAFLYKQCRGNPKFGLCFCCCFGRHWWIVKCVFQARVIWLLLGTTKLDSAYV